MNAKKLIAQAYEAHMRDHTAYFEACSNPLCKLAYAADADLDAAKSEARFLSGVIAGMESTDNERIQAAEALVYDWRFRADNQPMPTDRAIGYKTCADELAAALRGSE